MRLVVFLLLLGLIWLPIALSLLVLVPDVNMRTIAIMSLLFAEFLLLLPWWGRTVHHQPQIWQTYGLVWTRQNGLELLLGLAIGLGSLLGLFLVQGWLGWVTWQPIEMFSLVPVVLQGSLTGLGTGLAEELVFRGWVLNELERDYSPSMALWSSSLLFACLHFIKPLGEIIRTFPQFPGLVLLGLTLVWAKRSTGTGSSSLPHRGRLGLPIGLHAGLVWGYYIVHVGALVTYSQRVPVWVTGIDQNPLAGVAGLGLLAGLAGWMGWRSRSGRVY
jgi:uncharacterized protein